jgi:hypothetical protein
MNQFLERIIYTIFSSTILCAVEACRFEKRQAQRCSKPYLTDLLLMTHLSQAFFTLVRRHFVALTFPTTRHTVLPFFSSFEVIVDYVDLKSARLFVLFPCRVQEQ